MYGQHEIGQQLVKHAAQLGLDFGVDSELAR